jgi:hypothetical protein
MKDASIKKIMIIDRDDSPIQALRDAAQEDGKERSPGSTSFIKKIKRSKGKTKHYFGEDAQNGIEEYLSNLLGNVKNPYEGNLDNHMLNGRFTQNTVMEGNFSGTISCNFVGYANESPVSGSMNEDANGYISGTFMGPGRLGTSNVNGNFTGFISGSFEDQICHEIYDQKIRLAFEGLVTGIIHTYKINFYGEDVYHIAHETVTFLYETLSKYDPNKARKAFSYFNVCAMNFLFQKSGALKKSRNRTLDIMDLNVANQLNEWDKPSYSQNYEDIIEGEEFFHLLVGELDNWLQIPNLHEDEMRMIETIKVLFKNSSDIEVINRKIIYQLIREIGNFSPTDVTKRFRSIRDKYKKFKNKYDNGYV